MARRRKTYYGKKYRRSGRRRSKNDGLGVGSFGSGIGSGIGSIIKLQMAPSLLKSRAEIAKSQAKLQKQVLKSQYEMKMQEMDAQINTKPLMLALQANMLGAALGSSGNPINVNDYEGSGFLGNFGAGLFGGKSTRPIKIEPTSEAGARGLLGI